MPELPEVETIRIQLSDLIVGLKISDIKILHPKSFIGDKKLALKSKITGVRRFGKMLVIDLEDNYSLAVHLKMTGNLLFHSDGSCRDNSLDLPVLDLPNKHTRVILEFESGDKLFFNDIRKFGWMKVVQTQNHSSKLKTFNLKDLISKLGPDPLNELTLQQFRQILKQSGRPIKLLLMDQQKLAGVGNIYANDALFLAKIHPKTSSMSISRDKAKFLYSNLLKVLKEGLKWKGASKTNFVDIFGRKGSKQEHFYVYGREKETCPNQCGGKIERMILGGRGTFYCRKCQSLK